MKRIYHYTTLESIKCILSNATLRLNALSGMDDLLEGGSIDFGDMAKYYYVSSWTCDDKENIPLWYMYTNELRGVRIEADETFVTLDEDEKSIIKNITDTTLIAYRVSCGKDNSFLVPVIYTDEYESCIDGYRGYINDRYNNVGRNKPTDWEFQKGVRFRIYGINKKYLASFGDNNFIKFSNSIINKKPNDIKYADIKFKINNLQMLIS
ncbi:MAG: hypothetical protein WCR27_03900 [Eubacteriales bacterium]